jgi:hypothetical protein
MGNFEEAEDDAAKRRSGGRGVPLLARRATAH